MVRQKIPENEFNETVTVIGKSCELQERQYINPPQIKPKQMSVVSVLFKTDL